MSPKPTRPFNARLIVRDLSIARGDRVILSGVSVTVEPGDALVLRGPNGAGKTTLLRALAGLLPPADGLIDVEHGGDSPRTYCGPANAMKPTLTIEENLRFWSARYGVSAGAIDTAVALFGLEPYRKRPAGILSTGYARRLGLARLIASNRPLWFVDEPTAGLDKASAAVFRDVVENHRQRGGAAIIATHEPFAVENARDLEIAAS